MTPIGRGRRAVRAEAKPPAPAQRKSRKSTSASLAATLRSSIWPAFLVFWLVALVVVALLVLVAWLNGPTTTVHVEASTESMEVYTIAGKTRPLHWAARGLHASICTDTEARAVPVTFGEDDMLEVEPGAHIVMERLEGSREFRMRIVAESPDGTASAPPPAGDSGACGPRLPVIWMTPDNRSHVLRGTQLVLGAQFTVEPGIPWTAPALVYPIEGRIEVGQEIGDGVQGMLLGGTVSVHAASREPMTRMLQFFHRRQTYVAEAAALQRGDRVAFSADRIGDEASEVDGGKGYVRVGAIGPLQTAYFVPSEKAEILRAGNARVEIELSVWNRIENEPALGGLIALLAIWIAAIEVMAGVAELKEKHAEKVRDRSTRTDATRESH